MRTTGQSVATGPAAPPPHGGPEHRPPTPGGAPVGRPLPGGERFPTNTAANGHGGREPAPVQGGQRGGRATAPVNYVYHGRTFERREAPAYRWPSGYRHEQLVIGAVLPRAFRHAAYIIAHYAVYGLDAPPPGYEWVRYGPDVVEVNEASGQIVEEVPGVFYADNAGQDAADVGYDPGPQQGYGEGPPQGYADGPQEQAPEPVYANPNDEMSAGVRALDDGDPARAVRLLGPALESGNLSGPTQELAYVKRAEANRRLHNYQQAQADLERATQLDPNDRQAQQLLGEVKRDQGPNYWPIVLAALGVGVVGGGSVFAAMRLTGRGRGVPTGTVVKGPAE